MRVHVFVVNPLFSAWKLLNSRLMPAFEWCVKERELFASGFQSD
jgi:hypothetical protein